MNFYISDIPEIFPIGEEFQKNNKDTQTALLIVGRPLWSFMFISFLKFFLNVQKYM